MKAGCLQLLSISIHKSSMTIIINKGVSKGLKPFEIVCKLILVKLYFNLPINIASLVNPLLMNETGFAAIMEQI